MAATGARWLRVDFDWSFIESERGTFRWDFSDRIVSRASACGFKIIALPAYTPAWARPAGTTDKHPPRDPGDFAAFVSQAVRRYRSAGVEVWEIWNEPNIERFWRPAPDPRAYATLLGAASAAVHAANPAAMVLSGGLSPAKDAADGSQVAPITFLENLYQAGAGPSFDAVAVHPYSFPVGPKDASVDWNQFVRLPQMHDLLVAHGDGGKQVWLTEYGAPTGGDGAVSEADQARFVSEAYAAVAGWPWAGPLLWYSFRDQEGPQSDRESHFGLFRHDFRPKLAAEAFAAVLKGPSAPAGTSP